MQILNSRAVVGQAQVTVATSALSHVWDQAGADRSPPPLWQLSDAITHLRQLLSELSDGCPLTDFLPKIGSAGTRRAQSCRVAVSSTLVAGLELAQAGTLALDQDKPWTSIRVQPREDRHRCLVEKTLARPRVLQLTRAKGSFPTHIIKVKLRRHICRKQRWANKVACFKQAISEK